MESNYIYDLKNDLARIAIRFMCVEIMKSGWLASRHRL